MVFCFLLINKGVALSAIILIGLAYFLGPLCKILPFVKHHLRYRKYFGLAGFALILLHVVFTLLQLSDRFPPSWYVDHAKGVILATAALIVFFFLAATSTKDAIHRLGGHNWKLLQRTGYIAYMYVLMHLWVATNGQLHKTHLIALTFGIVVIAARLLVLLIDHVKPRQA